MTSDSCTGLEISGNSSGKRVMEASLDLSTGAWLRSAVVDIGCHASAQLSSALFAPDD